MGLKFSYLLPTKNRDRDVHERAQAGRPWGVGPTGPGGFSAPWTQTFSEVPPTNSKPMFYSKFVQNKNKTTKIKSKREYLQTYLA